MAVELAGHTELDHIILEAAQLRGLEAKDPRAGVGLLQRCTAPDAISLSPAPGAYFARRWQPRPDGLSYTLLEAPPSPTHTPTHPPARRKPALAEGNFVHRRQLGPVLRRQRHG